MFITLLLLTLKAEMRSNCPKQNIKASKQDMNCFARPVFEEFLDDYLCPVHGCGGAMQVYLQYQRVYIVATGS